MGEESGSKMKAFLHALGYTGVFVLCYIPAVLFLAPGRLWVALWLMGASVGLMVFLVSLFAEEGKLA